MSIPFSGIIGRLTSPLTQQLKLINLTPVKRIDIRFNPYDDQCNPTRYFLYYVNAEKVRLTNPQCSVKTVIASDRSEPTVTFSLLSGEKVIFKTARLSILNILELYNKHITSLIPPDPAKLQAEKELEEEKRKKKTRPHHKKKLWSKRRGVFFDV
ncbi:hypothetical protein PUN28_009936 [Cardiocondyla obscurior]|uniref:Large ribosomal subunit protein mL53 n=1 Tax=Cardiocondyla obscurior TaxID=286306 RepID=A0AAW2FPF1_9HYME